MTGNPCQGDHKSLEDCKSRVTSNEQAFIGEPNIPKKDETMTEKEQNTDKPSIVDRIRHAHRVGGIVKTKTVEVFLTDLKEAADEIDRLTKIVDSLPKDCNGETVLPFDHLICERKGFEPIELVALCGYSLAHAKDFRSPYLGVHVSVMRKIKVEGEGEL